MLMNIMTSFIAGVLLILIGATSLALPDTPLMHSLVVIVLGMVLLMWSYRQ